jgi:hypothetical protein
MQLLLLLFIADHVVCTLPFKEMDIVGATTEQLSMLNSFLAHKHSLHLMQNLS